MCRFLINTVLIFVLCLVYCRATGQSRKELGAVRVSSPITIDGRLTEPGWQGAGSACAFTQFSPVPGEPSTQQAAVKIRYDNDAVYVGAMLYDSFPDSIARQLSSRDDDGGYTDVFGVYFDTYNDQQNATQFGVTAAGVQLDAIVKFDGVNRSWNAAWYSKVSITDSGWAVEMKIPYSAIRFPKSDTQLWGVNFFRVIKRYKETSYWSTVLPTISNRQSQAGLLTGVSDIVSPMRLALLPYVSAYAEDYNGHTVNSLNGGMDIKYGVSESFTIDMTLVPDFGQTIYDNRVLNLSPIETRYNENRYFFTEGLDLFNKNDLFYSRRVGGIPVKAGNIPLDSGEVVTSNPVSTRLYNATKISGRTKGNLGIGFFNAVAEPTYANVYDFVSGTSRSFQTAPLTNYNVVVLDQALKNNSYISLINTNVWRQENSYNADVSALLFKFANRANTYGLSGSGDISQLFSGPKPDVGYRYNLNFGKTSGNYTWNFTARTISDRFNPNDLGYLDRNNLSYYLFEQYYNIYRPVGSIVEAYNHFGIDLYRVFRPDAFQQAEVFGSHNVTFRNYLTIGCYWTLQPITGYDYNEPRVFGRYYRYPKNYMWGGFYSSDYRKRFALDLEATNRLFAEEGRNTFSWSVSPRYRFSDKLSMIYSLSGQTAANDVGFTGIRGDSIFFGLRNVGTVTNSLDAAYIFTSRMSLKLNARHYWSQARYEKYYLLGGNGELVNTGGYNANKNVNFNTFNVFMSFVWQFRPGSEMTVVYQNSIFSSPASPEPVADYFTDLSNTLRAPQSNSLSVKVIYYLDYLNLRRTFDKG